MPSSPGYLVIVDTLEKIFVTLRDDRTLRHPGCYPSPLASPAVQCPHPYTLWSQHNFSVYAGAGGALIAETSGRALGGSPRLEHTH